MHRFLNREARQLCESKPFELFCASPLPTPDQRIVCRACGLPVDDSGHGHQEEHTACRVRRLPGVETITMHGEKLKVLSDPEEHWADMDRPPWTAPYVWETNYQ